MSDCYKLVFLRFIYILAHFCLIVLGIFFVYLALFNLYDYYQQSTPFSEFKVNFKQEGDYNGVIKYKAKFNEVFISVGNLRDANKLLNVKIKLAVKDNGGNLLYTSVITFENVHDIINNTAVFKNNISLRVKGLHIPISAKIIQITILSKGATIGEKSVECFYVSHAGLFPACIAFICLIFDLIGVITICHLHSVLSLGSDPNAAKIRD